MGGGKIMGVPYTTKEDRRNERYTEEERERIFELYASGMSIADIATRFKGRSEALRIVYRQDGTLP